MLVVIVHTREYESGLMLYVRFFRVLFPHAVRMRDGLSKWKCQARLGRARLRLPLSRGSSPSEAWGLGSQGQHFSVGQDIVGGAGGVNTERCGLGHFVDSICPYFELVSSILHWFS